MKHKLLLFLFVILFISGCTQKTTGDELMEKISFRTEDGVTIVGNYLVGSDTAILLLHMMPAAKESWNDFAKALNQEGFSVLAIDLRGHGESTKQNGNILNYRQFTDEQHQASIKDVEAAVDYLTQKGVTTIHIAGASIGANLALQYQSEHPEIKKSILLSAGLNYRGVLTEPSAQKLNEDQNVFLLAGNLDSAAAEAINRLPNLIKGDKEVGVYDTSTHGTDLFKEYPSLISELVTWLKS